MPLTLLIASVLSSAPVQLIIDTDLGFDVDDVGALAVAHALFEQIIARHIKMAGKTGVRKKKRTLRWTGERMPLKRGT